MRSNVLIYLLFSLFFIPVFFVSASVRINEIMYDHEGADTKKEWIEIFNDGPDDVDLSTFKLKENDTNHAIKTFGSVSILSSGQYAIIADSPVDIELELPQDAVIFDSTFSLSNSGELLSLVDSNGLEIDSIFYDVNLGANGDGNSLNLIDGIWLARIASPGAENITVDTPADSSDSNDNVDSTNQNTNISSVGGSSSEVKKIFEKEFNLKVTIPETIIVGEAALFEAKAFDIYGQEITQPHFVWTFGDGTTSVGERVAHTYKKSARYSVFVEGNYIDTNDSLKQIVQVKSDPILLENYTAGTLESSVDISNTSSFEFDVSKWTLMSNGNIFTLPEHTFILPKSSITLTDSITGWSIGNDVKLLSLYGNFINIAVKNEDKKQIVEKKVSTKVVKSTTEKNNTVVSGVSKKDNTALVAKGVTGNGNFVWIALLFVVLGGGALLLFFLQKKTNLVDEIDIIE